VKKCTEVAHLLEIHRKRDRQSLPVLPDVSPAFQGPVCPFEFILDLICHYVVLCRQKEQRHIIIRKQIVTIKCQKPIKIVVL